jgi:hypothetical protein
MAELPCRFSFHYKGVDLCVLEENCASKDAASRKSCQSVKEFFQPGITSQEIDELKKKRIRQYEIRIKAAPPEKSPEPPKPVPSPIVVKTEFMTDNPVEVQNKMLAFKEKTKGLHIKF